MGIERQIREEGGGWRGEGEGRREEDLWEEDEGREEEEGGERR